MTTTSLANPRRTSLSTLTVGSELAACESGDGQRCHNVAVVVQKSPEGGRMLVCRAHAR